MWFLSLNSRFERKGKDFSPWQWWWWWWWQGWSLGGLCGKLKKTHTRRRRKQHRLAASETKWLPTSLFEEASAGSLGWRGVLEDSAPSGEELPGDGDWNTARKGHSECLGTRKHPRAAGSRGESPTQGHTHFYGEITCQGSHQQYLKGLGFQCFLLNSRHVFKGILESSAITFPP